MPARNIYSNCAMARKRKSPSLWRASWPLICGAGAPAGASAQELGWNLSTLPLPEQPKPALVFTKPHQPRQSVPQGGTLLDAAADPKGSSLRMVAFHPRRFPRSKHDFMGVVLL